jgi:hypothetical protein
MADQGHVYSDHDVNRRVLLNIYVHLTWTEPPFQLVLKLLNLSGRIPFPIGPARAARSA